MFQSGDFKKAVRLYLKVVEYLDHEDKLEEEDAAKRTALLLAAHLNLGMCYLKLDHNLDAKNECDKALEIEEKSEKALFRRGTVRIITRSVAIF